MIGPGEWQSRLCHCRPHCWWYCRRRLGTSRGPCYTPDRVTDLVTDRTRVYGDLKLGEQDKLSMSA